MPLCAAQPAPKDPRPRARKPKALIRTLLLWAGDDPDREGLRDTPARVARAFEDWFSGYAKIPKPISPAPSRRSRL